VGLTHNDGDEGENGLASRTEKSKRLKTNEQLPEDHIGVIRQCTKPLKENIAVRESR
jgi:hypothetical protein